MNSLAKAAALTLALMLGGLRIHVSNGKQQQDAKTLFERAYTLTNLEAKGNPAFLLKATITVHAIDGRRDNGRYILKWRSADESRKEVAFPDYHEVTVTNAAKTWRSSDSLYHPYKVFQFKRAVSFADRLKVSPGKALVKVRRREIHGISDECSGIFLKRFEAPHEFCFDPATGYLIQERDPTWFTTLELSDYTAVGGKVFPRTLRVLQDGQLMVEAKVTELVLNPKINDDQFAGLPGIQPSPGSPCQNDQIQHAQIIKKTLPRYPPLATWSRRTGTIVLYAEIGKDGIPRGISVLRSPGPEFSGPSLAAVRQWRYQPANCEGNPVEVGAALDVSFTYNP